MSGSRAPEELREAVALAVSDKVKIKIDHNDAWLDNPQETAGAALAAVEARYPGCWETLERAKAADDFAARRMNE